jgi:hypothetical protein
LARAVDLLCQASGVAEWTAEEVCGKVEGVRIGSGGRVGKYRWPIEVSAETMRGLAMYVSLNTVYGKTLMRVQDITC